MTLEEFRKNLGGTRAEQDAFIKQGRLAGKYSLNTFEGLHGTQTPGMRAASIVEGRDSTRFVYISRRE